MSKYVLEFELKGLPNMANKTLRGTGWKVNLQHTRKWKRMVWMETRMAVKPPEPLKSAVLELTRISSIEPDFDGLVSGFKAVIDGLVESGIIASDKMSCIGQPKFSWEKGKRSEGRIRIKVLEN